ncbi:hypothetical protein JCM4914_00770 [Streptomyces platensis subsp. malvinus]
MVYVKPHRALCHSAAPHEEHAEAIIGVMLSLYRLVLALCHTGALLAQDAGRRTRNAPAFRCSARAA